MGSAPGAYLTELRGAGALAAWLPEVSALFGVPTLSDAAEPEYPSLGRFAPG